MQVSQRAHVESLENVLLMVKLYLWLKKIFLREIGMIVLNLYFNIICLRLN